MKKFDLEAALKGEPVVTRAGQKVSEIYHFKTVDQEQMCIGYVIENERLLRATHKNGLYVHRNDDDLFMAPKPKKKMWLAITTYPGRNPIGFSKVHETTRAYLEKDELIRDIQRLENIENPQIIEIEIEEEMSRINVSTKGYGGDTSGPIGNFRAVEGHTFGAGEGGCTGAPNKVTTEFNDN